MSPINALAGIMAALLVVSTQAQALPEDRDQPIAVVADRAEIDDQRGIATYTGEVRITQGSLEIRGDQVQIFSDNDGVNRMVAEGQPAELRQRPTPGAPMDEGYGQRIEYQLTSDEITLIDQARLVRDKNTFTGKRIHIDLNEDIVNAFSGESEKDDRVRMILQPKKEAQP